MNLWRVKFRVLVLFLLDLYKEKYFAIGMGNMKKAYWLTMNNVIWKKIPHDNLLTFGEQTKSRRGKMCKQYHQEKGILGTNTEALEWIWYNKMDDILVGTTKVDGIPQGMDMGKILEHKLTLKRLMVTSILTVIQHHQLFKFQFFELL